MSMASDSLSVELRQFVANYLTSVEQLEVLCLLSENPGKAFSAPEAFRSIQSSEKSVADCLEAFRGAGLVVSDTPGTYRFAPREQQQAQLVAELAKTYRERRVSVIECIYRKPPGLIQEFAEAFRLRKEK